jgi:hypothetical protein
LDFVKTVKVGSGANSCQLVYTTCETTCGECTWEATGTEPPFTWSKTGDCSGDCTCAAPPYPPESLNETATTRCSGGTGTPTEHPIMNLDWVTRVAISGCNLVVTKRCSGTVTTSPLSNFVVAVDASSSGLYYVQCNGTVVPVIGIGPCPPSDCGECTWEASGTAPPFSWVKTGDCATNDCTCTPPEEPPQSLNDTATTPCSQE